MAAWRRDDKETIVKSLHRFALSVSGAIAASLLAGQPTALAQPTAETGVATPDMTALDSQVRYQTVTVEGIDVFYREAGSAHAPVLLLLHGFPASSFMYRDLIGALSDRFRVIAPDYPGFGYSDAPSTSDFAYTFDHLTDIIDEFTRRVGVEKYSIYMQDFGGPVGFRLATRGPQRVTSLIIQNANAYEEGLPDSFWTPARTLWAVPSTANYERLRDAALSDDALEWNYTHGVKDRTAINPDSWVLQRALLSRPGNKDAMLALLYDYRTNLGRYSEWHEYFRGHRPPTLIVWGENDVIFPATGARAYLQDLPDAELHLLDSGHFALEDHAEEIARLMRLFFDRLEPG
jgi:pimeloyl-ACP methyl ester carboxylesterase